MKRLYIVQTHQQYIGYFLGIVDTSLLCVSVSLRLCVFKIPPQLSSSKNLGILLVLVLLDNRDRCR